MSPLDMPAGVHVLEHVVRRAGLAVQLGDLATGQPVRDGCVVSAWPAARPDLAVTTRAVSAAGVAGFHRFPGLASFEDGSTVRDDWFRSPPVHAPVPAVVRVVDTTGAHLPVLRQLPAPTAAPVELALPRSPAAPPPSGALAVVAQLVTEAGEPASWAVVELAVDGFLTGGVADARGMVVVPVPRAVAPTDPGSPQGGPVWRLTVTARYRPADQDPVPGAAQGDPPDLTSLLAQQPALLDDGGELVGSLTRDLITGGPLVVSSEPSPAPSVLVVRPTP